MEEIIGNIYINGLGNKFTVVDKAGRAKHDEQLYLIRFESGYETIAPKSFITGKYKPKDLLSPSVHGVGILGYLPMTENERLFQTWRAMIARCYNPKNPSYKTYGAKGITVCERWKRWDYFYEDVIKLPGYKEDLEGLDLDKDIKGGKEYNSENCQWISHGANVSESAYRMWRMRKCNDQSKDVANE